MSYLKKGSTGTEVIHWQTKLTKLGYEIGVSDGIFGMNTHRATQKFQLDNNLISDGIVGPITIAIADKLLNPGNPPNGESELGADYPPVPTFSAISTSERERLFGGFTYTINPDSSIAILDNWAAENIKIIEIPQLRGVENPYGTNPISGNVYFHIKVHNQVRSFFEELEREGIHKDILTWGGSFVPRLVRGSSTRLSNHSYGTAFDINMEWNGLNQQPTLMGNRGCVRHIAHIANKYGFYWGGHFKTRKDGMHFEVAELI